MQYKKQLHIRISQVPDEVDKLHAMYNKAGVPYRNEHILAVAYSIFPQRLNLPRRGFTIERKNEVRQRQPNCCAGRNRELSVDAELRNVIALAK